MRIHQDAAECYEKAWTLGHCTNAAVGFKLGFNYLKAERGVEAIDVCSAVLKMSPAYPRYVH